MGSRESGEVGGGRTVVLAASARLCCCQRGVRRSSLPYDDVAAEPAVRALLPAALTSIQQSEPARTTQGCQREVQQVWFRAVGPVLVESYFY
jgi:hypothetical protein